MTDTKGVTRRIEADCPSEKPPALVRSFIVDDVVVVIVVRLCVAVVYGQSVCDRTSSYVDPLSCVSRSTECVISSVVCYINYRVHNPFYKNNWKKRIVEVLQGARVCLNVCESVCVCEYRVV